MLNNMFVIVEFCRFCKVSCILVTDVLKHRILSYFLFFFGQLKGKN